jgi:hypothetical protein
MERTENYWIALAVIGIVFILLAGLYTGVPTWVDYLDYGLLACGIIALLFAAIEFRKPK